MTPTRGFAKEPDPLIIGYFGGWTVNSGYSLKQLLTNGAIEKLSVINYAFGRITPYGPGGALVAAFRNLRDDYLRPWTAEESIDGVAVPEDAPLRGNLQQLKRLKELYPQLKIMIALGGWTGSVNFSDAALTEESRRIFVESAIDLYIKGNLPKTNDAGGDGVGAGIFDGIDVDWEFPGTAGFEGDEHTPGTGYRPDVDRANFLALMAELRRQMDAVDPKLLLTFAAPATISRLEYYGLNEVGPSIDWVNLMTYDLNDANGSVTNHQANLFHPQNKPEHIKERTSLDTAVRYALEAGIPKDKIVTGIPFYGRGWADVPSANHGLYQPASGAAMGTFEWSYEMYKHMIERAKLPGMTRYWDEQAQAAYLYDGSTFWSYEDEQSIMAKMAYIREQGIKGAMFWEMAGDDLENTLLNTMYRGLQGAEESLDRGK
jgi:chitinase